MYSHAACIGVMVFLLFCPGASGVPVWRVDFTTEGKCVPLGSSVDIGCSYTYPSDNKVETTLWLIQDTLVDFSSAPHQGRLMYLGDNHNNCTLRITDVRHSDAGEYKFRFITNTPVGKWTSKSAFTLSVAALQVAMSPAWVTKGQTLTLTCSTTCPLSTNPTFTWSKPLSSQPIIRGNTLTLTSVSEIDAGSYSCAIKGLEDHPSYSVCVLGCWSVTYNTPQSICAVEGSSVDMSCSYSYPNNVTVTKTFWHKQGSVEDLKNTGAYKNRVTYLGNTRNECGLKIESVRESDSGEYQFQFITNDPRGNMSGSPGVTLLVSSLQVMMSSAAVTEGGTVSLTCNSTCPANNITYTWFQNRAPLTQHTSRDLILDPVNSDDAGNYSCAEGNEKYPSPEVTLSVQSGATPLNRFLLIAVGVVLAVTFTMVTGIVCFRRKRKTSTEGTGRQTSDDRGMSMQREGMQDTEQQGDSSLVYNVSAVTRTSDQQHRVDSVDQDDVAYASVQFKTKNKDGVPDSTAGEEASVNVLSPSSGASIGGCCDLQHRKQTQTLNTKDHSQCLMTSLVT
ncbi:B-cell receptor CD22-like [Alosa sapidissima]|nr:B-cell receptor CD22-like [Alosa sapidissima]